MESYGCSDVVAKVSSAELVSPTAPTQSRWFTSLNRALREQRFRFPASAGIDPQTKAGGLLQTELLAFEAEAPRGDSRGGVHIRFGTRGGTHDDSVYSVVIAMDALATMRGGFVGIASPPKQHPDKKKRVSRADIQPPSMLGLR